MKLGEQDWRRVFARVAAELAPPTQRHVTVIGGVAMALGYGSRRTTEDADVVMAQDVASDVLAAAERIAPEFSLPSGWLNQKAIEANKIMPPSPDRSVFATPTLVLEVPSNKHMLAMKVARFARGTDLEDATILLKSMQRQYADVEDIWTHIGGLVPVAQREQAHYNLLRLWEDVYGSAP